MDATLAGIPRSIELYEAALEGLVRVNEALYRRHRNWPSVLDAGARVRYERERGEVWRHVGDVLKSGWGDCEDLAAAQVAWLRVRKGERGAKVMVKRTGPRMSHAVVKRANGRIEDPSRKLGMGRGAGVTNITAAVAVPSRAAAALPAAAAASPPSYYGGGGGGGGGGGSPDEEVIDVEADLVSDNDDDNDADGDWETIGADVSESLELSFAVQREANGWRGTVRVPLAVGKMLLVSRTDGKKEGAASRAMGAASKVLDNPAVAALIPPQAKFALNLARSETARNMAKSILKLF